MAQSAVSAAGNRWRDFDHYHAFILDDAFGVERVLMAEETWTADIKHLKFPVNCKIFMTKSQNPDVDGACHDKSNNDAIQVIVERTFLRFALLDEDMDSSL